MVMCFVIMIDLCLDDESMYEDIVIDENVVDVENENIVWLE